MIWIAEVGLLKRLDLNVLVLGSEIKLLIGGVGLIIQVDMAMHPRLDNHDAGATNSSLLHEQIEYIILGLLPWGKLCTVPCSRPQFCLFRLNCMHLWEPYSANEQATERLRMVWNYVQVLANRRKQLIVPVLSFNHIMQQTFAT